MKARGKTPLTPVHIEERVKASIQDAIATRKKERKRLEHHILSLETQIKACTGRIDLRKKQDLETKMAVLQRELQNLITSKLGETLYNRTIPFLQEYQRQKDVSEIEEKTWAKLPTKKKSPNIQFGHFVTDGGVAIKKSKVSQASDIIAKDYMIMVHGDPPELIVGKDDICDGCGDTMQINAHQGMMSCASCGLTRVYTDTTLASTSYGDDVEFTSFSYQRVNHFKEWLVLFQAKESTVIKQAAIDLVSAEFKEFKDEVKKNITMRQVLQAMQKLQLKEYYKHQTQMWCLVTGNAPPRMIKEQEEKCKLMFEAIQTPFDKHKPPNRRNFLSYPYCLYKFNELLGYTSFLKYFPLLKGKDKLDAQDSIFELICKDNNWEFKKSKVTNK